MHFSDDDILQFKLYVQKITMNLRPIDDQPHITKDGHIWCEDWKIIEILKYLFNGHDGYMGDPPPNRLKNNPLWSKELIVEEAQALINTYQTAPAIIDALKTMRARKELGNE